MIRFKSSDKDTNTFDAGCSTTQTVPQIIFAFGKSNPNKTMPASRDYTYTIPTPAPSVDTHPPPPDPNANLGLNDRPVASATHNPPLPLTPTTRPHTSFLFAPRSGPAIDRNIIGFMHTALIHARHVDIERVTSASFVVWRVRARGWVWRKNAGWRQRVMVMFGKDVEFGGRGSGDQGDRRRLGGTNDEDDE
ncbi:hypothetical protein P153DRAFT_390464 [Dothidotthia symphoricarpi CBS 119687]|uniref:Uncharacterized protein n=1 Tax=Dothidotthia symphoricarpi CBS 119687 TaxID=1392245 RepID=A0A6A5ZXC9_9PLEO|nr:uncharacterized protein P153DRAFT_390464 [Dothidotthia symphoricarpi CBS 119687]KAF2124422.1 hypothetical protein P153DRAFT_390464 [Dothidotthia symphoricarpi CBS 119687]